VTAARPRPSGRRLLLTTLVDIAAPIALFYGLRAAGASTFVALLAGSVAPAVSVGVQWARERRLDAMAAFVAAVLLLSVTASLVSGSTRFMLAKDGWVTGLGGLWFLASVRARRPLAFLGGRPLLEGRFRSDGTSWDVLWEREPSFRRIWRVSTVIWATAMLADAAARIVMAYTLPVDAVPGLGGLLWPVTLVLLQVVNGVHYEAAGLWRLTSGAGRTPDDSSGGGGTRAQDPGAVDAPVETG
jgi:intracellular septation protein A